MKTIKSILIFSLFVQLCIIQNATAGVEDCRYYVDKGMHNTFIKNGLSIDESAASSAFCKEYESYKSSGSSTDADFGYKKILSLGSSKSKEQIAQVGEAMCSNNSNERYSDNQLKEIRKVISSEAIEGYKACLAAIEKGVIVSRDFVGQTVTIGLRFIPPAGVTQTEIKLTGYNIEPSEIADCKGPLIDELDGAGSNGIKLGSEVKSLVCVRDINSVNQEQEGIQTLSPVINITVHTAAQPVVTSLLPIYGLGANASTDHPLVGYWTIKSYTAITKTLGNRKFSGKESAIRSMIFFPDNRCFQVSTLANINKDFTIAKGGSQYFLLDYITYGTCTFDSTNIQIFGRAVQGDNTQEVNKSLEYELINPTKLLVTVFDSDDGSPAAKLIFEKI